MAGRGLGRWFAGLLASLALALAVAPVATRAVIARAASIVPTVEVQVQQEGLGWRAPVADGGSSGGDGSGLALTGVRIAYGPDPAIEGGIVYQLANPAGTWGGDRRGDGMTSRVPGGIGGIRARLTGEAAEHYDLFYRVSVPHVGWRGWARNGEEAGSLGLGRPIEALCVRIVPKGAVPPASAEADPVVGPPQLVVDGYVSGQGSPGEAPSGAVFGVEYRALHDLSLALRGDHRLPGGVSYRVRTGEWRPWVSSGSACPVIPDAPIYTLEARLDGACARYYDLWYRVHACGLGWLDWTGNGGTAGTVGIGVWLDQVQVSLLPKGSPAPGATGHPTVERVPLSMVLRNIADAPGWLSGFGGATFDPASPEGVALQGAIAKVTAGGRQVAFVMADLTTGKGLACNANAAIYGASSIKGPYVVACNKFHPGLVTPWVRATMAECISISCNDCYRKLRNTFGPQPIADMQACVGGCSFTPYANFVWLTPKDLSKLWVGAYDYFANVPNENAAWCRDLFTTSYNSFIRAALGWKATTYTKPGWIASNSTYLARNDAGIVMAGDRPYVVAILSTAYGRDGALEELTRAIDAIHATMVGR